MFYSSSFEASVATSSSVASSTTGAAAAIRASLAAFSAARAFASCASLAFWRSDFLASILACFSKTQAWNFSSACSSVKAPFFTPPARCFFNKTPSCDKIARVVSVGWAPFSNHFTAPSTLRSICAGLVLGLYVPSFSRKRPSLFERESAATIQ